MKGDREHDGERVEPASGERRTTAQRDRAEAQEAQLEAQGERDTAGELRQAAHEIVADQRQFLGDVVEDLRHPERREGEQQAAPTGGAAGKPRGRR